MSDNLKFNPNTLVEEIKNGLSARQLFGRVSHGLFQARHRYRRAGTRHPRLIADE